MTGGVLHAAIHPHLHDTTGAHFIIKRPDQYTSKEVSGDYMGIIIKKGQV